MDGKTRKLILVGIGLIALIALASVCSDVFLVIAFMSVLTNLLVFADLGHKFWGEMLDGDEKVSQVGSNKSSDMTDADVDNKVNEVISQLDDPYPQPRTQYQSKAQAVVSDTMPDTYIPARNVGHIGYYEDPLLESDEMFPKYYGDIDNATVGYEKRRIRDEQSITGAVNKTADHFKCFYRSEFADQESKNGWWGNMDI